MQRTIGQINQSTSMLSQKRAFWLTVRVGKIYFPNQIYFTNCISLLITWCQHVNIRVRGEQPFFSLKYLIKSQSFNFSLSSLSFSLWELIGLYMNEHKYMHWPPATQSIDRATSTSGNNHTTLLVILAIGSMVGLASAVVWLYSAHRIGPTLMSNAFSCFIKRFIFCLDRDQVFSSFFFCVVFQLLFGFCWFCLPFSYSFYDTLLVTIFWASCVLFL